MPVSLTSQGVQYANATVRTSGKWATRAIFGYGYTNAANPFELMISRVSNTGVFESDVIISGSTSRIYLAAAGYGGDKAIFGFGGQNPYVSTTSLVSNAGVLSSDITNVGTARGGLAASSYGS